MAGPSGALARAHPIVLADDSNELPIDTLLRLAAALPRRAVLVTSGTVPAEGFGRFKTLVVPSGCGPLDRIVLAAICARGKQQDATLAATPPLPPRCGGTDDAVLALADAASAAVEARCAVAMTAPVDWATRGIVLEPNGPRDPWGTRAIRELHRIKGSGDLDHHLEVGTSVAPTGAFSVPVWVLLDRVANVRPDVLERCRIALADGRAGDRVVRVRRDGWGDGSGRLLDLFDHTRVRCHAGGVHFRRSSGHRARPALLPPGPSSERSAVVGCAARPQVGFGMIWRMPGERRVDLRR